MSGGNPLAVEQAKFPRWMAAALLLAIHFGLAATSILHKCTTVDEVGFISGGYSYWRTADYRLFQYGAMLTMRWQTLPLALGRYAFPTTDQKAWWSGDVWNFGHQLFYEMGNDAQQMLLWSRLMTCLMSVALGLVVYFWSRRLFGDNGALVSLTAYAFCPSILANASLATADLPVSLFLTLSLYTVWTAWHDLNPRTALWSCLSLAALFQSKMSAMLIIPMGLVLLAIRLLRGRFQQTRYLALLTVLQVLTVVFFIWLSYGFRYDAFSAADQQNHNTHINWQGMLPGGDVWPGERLVTNTMTFLREHRVLPEFYLGAIAITYVTTQVRNTFLNGQASGIGWWYYFPYSFLVKTPLPLLALLALAAVALARWPHLYDTAPLWVCVVVYWTVAMAGHVNIGHRHVLPTYPSLLVLAGAGAHLGRAGRWLVGGLLLALAVEMALVWPNYLAYFNQIAGGSANGYRHLVDSSLDWGQDLPGLYAWLQAHPQDRADMYLSYFGTGDPSYYGIVAHRLPSFWHPPLPRIEVEPLRPGTYCISATMLQSLYNLHAFGAWTADYEQRYRTLQQSVRQSPTDQQVCSEFEEFRFARLCAYLRQHRSPDAQVDYTILIYHLSDVDLKQALE